MCKERRGNASTADRMLVDRSGARRAVPFTLVLLGGLLLSLLLFFGLRHWDTRLAEGNVRTEFYTDASDRIGAIRRESDKHVQALQALAAFHEASQLVTRHEFQTFATKILETNPSIHAVEWVPRVSHTQRTRFEEEARESVPGYNITELREDGVLVPAMPRDEYYPVYFIEPNVGNEPALGFDLASEPVRREALQRARDTGQVAASGPITLVQQATQQAAFLVYLPIYQKGKSVGSVAERRQHLEGFMLGVCRVASLVELALAHLAGRNIDLWLFDTTADSEAPMLYAYVSQASAVSGPGGLRQPPTTGLFVSDSLQVGGRQWKIVAAPAPGTFLPSVPHTAWVVLIAGLAITGLLAWYLNALQRHAARLVQANRSLDREVAEHRQAERALRQSEMKFRQVLESAADAILIFDKHGQILIANSQSERLFGYTVDELIGQGAELLVPEALRDRHTDYRKVYYTHPRPRRMGEHLEVVARHRDGSLVPVEISLSPVDSEQGLMVTAIVRDISRRKRIEARLQRLNRTHAVLSRCNRSLARAIDEVTLLNDFCRTLVEVGGYPFAWVGYAQQDEDRPVRLMARAGQTDEEFSVTIVTGTGRAEQGSPSQLVTQTGKPVVLRDIEKESRFPLWRDAALREGYRSMIDVPLRAGGAAFGNFSIYSTEQGVFDDEEVGLLTELAEDLAFGIQTLRNRAAREQKVRLLREEVEREEQKRLAAALHDGAGQSMQAVNLGLKRLRALTSDDTTLASDLLDRLVEEVGSVIVDLRNITQGLRPPVLERMGLLEAVRYECNEMSERSGVSIYVATNEGSFQLDDRVKEQCFLCVREALNNAITHARATQVDVTLELSDSGWLIFRIADDGRGFDPEAREKAPSGLGLSMMPERAESVGGRVEIYSVPGEGTTVVITVPLIV